MWTAISTRFIPSLLKQLHEKSPRQIAQPAPQMTAHLFRAVYAERGAIVGREIPGSAGQEFSAFGPSDYPAWYFDWVTDTATSSLVPGAKPQYWGIRVLTSAEWAAMNGVDDVERTDKTGRALAVEADCVGWLKQSWPQSQNLRKPDWLREARQKWGLSPTAFNRAWVEAAKVFPKMSARGAPKKIMPR